MPDPQIKRQKRVLQGDVPSPVNPPPGCHFHTRCPYAIERCKVEVAGAARGAAGPAVACHLALENSWEPIARNAAVSIPKPKCPLDGIRVLDLSRLVAGNMLSLQLADFGAEVIKIEDPRKGDPLRDWRVAATSACTGRSMRATRRA